VKAKIRLLIVDDYPVVLSGLIAMFKNHEDLEVVGVANNGVTAVDLAVLESLKYVAVIPVDLCYLRLWKSSMESNLHLNTSTGPFPQINSLASDDVTDLLEKLSLLE